MTEQNASITIKGEEESLIPLQICTNESKNFDISLKDGRRNSIAKSKNRKQRESLRCLKKKHAKQTCKTKQKNKKAQKKGNILKNMLLNLNEDECKYQIQKTNLMLKQSPKYPTLTQNELYMLYAKYKLDGHYKSNENLPPFSILSMDAQNASNANSQFYNNLPHMETLNPRSSNDLIAPTYYNDLNENQYGTNAEKFVETNFKYDLLNCTETRESNANNDNRLENNKYLYANQNFATTSNYNYNHNHNYAFMNHNVQAHGDADILSDIQNLAQPKANNLDAEKIANTEKNYYACNLTNAPGIISEDYQNCRYANKNVFCNVPDFSVPYESLNANNGNEIVQQNDAHSTSQINNFALNANICNDLHLDKWNNAAVLAKNNSYESLKNDQSISIPRASNLESFCALKQSNFNSPIQTDAYSAMGNKNFGYIASNDDVNNVQQDINTYAGNSVAMLDKVYSGTNGFFSSYSSIVDQYN